MSEGHVNRTLLEIELANLKQQYQQKLNDVNAFLGAIQFCEHLIKTVTGDTIVPVTEKDDQTDPSA